MAALSCTVECFDGAAAAFEVGGHVVEAADEFAKLFGGAFADAVGVVSSGDGLHRVAQCFHRPGDLLRDMQRKPTGGEERKDRHHQQQAHVEISDLATLAEENPVGIGFLAETGHG